MILAVANRSLVGIALLGVGAGLLGLDSQPAGAQDGSYAILIVPPLPTDPADSAFALDLGNELRERMRHRHREVIRSREMCRMAKASDVSCRKLLRGEEVAHLATALGAGAFLTGSLRRTPDVVLNIRATSRRTRAGMAGSIAVEADAGLDADSIASLAAAALETLWRAAGRARACYEARDAGRYLEASRFAEDALAMVTNHSLAALCLASVFELTHQPPDSLIKAYGRAVAGDPQLHEIQRRLALLYFQEGDTLNATRLLTEDLRRDPDNANLRARVVANWVAGGEPDSAFQFLPAARRGRIQRLSLLRIIGQACLEREMWRCQVEALAGQYELDSDLVGDTAFYFQIIGAAQNVGDVETVLAWTSEALRMLPPTRSSPSVVRSLWMAYADVLRDTGARDDAVAVYLDLWRGDTTDVRPALAAAEALVDPQTLGIDSTTSPDTAALRMADSLLTDLASRNRDSAVSQTIATIYFTPAAALVRGKAAPELASAWLEKAMSFDVDGRMHETASSLNGLALSYVVQQLDTRIRAEPSCALVSRLQETVMRARGATLAGQMAFPDLAQQVLQGLEGYAGLVPRYREILQCRG